MQRDTGIDGECPQKFLCQLGIEAANHRRHLTAIIDQEGPAADIQRNQRQRLIHRQIECPIAADTGLIADGLPECLPHRDADILDRMMSIHFQITITGQRQVHQTMRRHEIKHVIEKADAGVNNPFAAAIEIQDQFDSGLGGLALDRCCTDAAHTRPSTNAFISAYQRSFSSRSPIEMRRQSLRPGASPKLRTPMPLLSRYSLSSFALA